MTKFSIITVNYNDARGLEKTIESVARQTYTDFEYIVIDGASTDGSLQVIEAQKIILSHWLSEKDTGVYEAMNKGLRLATGTYVLFLNSGDYFLDEQVLENAAFMILGDQAIYYGNLLFRSDREEYVREYPKELTFRYFLDRSLPHPGSFIKRTLFDELFYYSENFKIISDWEFFIYAICKAEVSYAHLEMTISVFDLQGMSNDPNNKARIEKEREVVYKKYFKPYYKDALACKQQQELLKSKNMVLLKQLSQHPQSKKWASRALRCVHFLFGKNKQP